jgi:hypothetical protein
MSLHSGFRVQRFRVQRFRLWFQRLENREPQNIEGKKNFIIQNP